MAVKKQWYEIISPKMFGSKVLGETLSIDQKYVQDRVIEITLMELSKDYSKFYLKPRFKVNKVEGNKAHTLFIGHTIMRERVSRMVQRRARKVDVVIDSETKDGVKIRLKSIVILLRRVGTSVKDSCRAKSKELIKKTIEENTLENLIKLIINGEIANNVKKQCKKISPIRDVEITKSELLKEKKIVGI